MSTCLQYINSFWKGVFAADFTLDHVRQRCAHLGKYLQEQGESCLVAYDSRFMSDIFAKDICCNLEKQGISVSLASKPTPLPAVQFALQQGVADCALVVSARNSPYWYNGLVLLKPSMLDQLLAPDTTMGTIPSTVPFPSTCSSETTDEIHQCESTIDLRNQYVEKLRTSVDSNFIRRSTMTIFVDPMHGSAAGYLPSAIGDESQTMAISINRESDPLFDKFVPLPSVANLTRLRKLVRESDSHMGLAFSADGTAIGIVDKNGNNLDYLDITLLLADYLSGQYRQRGLVIAPPPTNGETISKSKIAAWQKLLGVEIEVTSAATDKIAHILSERNQDLLIGCTPDGEVVLGNYNLYPDAILTGLLMIEMLARSGRTLRTLLDELRSRMDES